MKIYEYFEDLKVLENDEDTYEVIMADRTLCSFEGMRELEERVEMFNFIKDMTIIKTRIRRCGKNENNTQHYNITLKVKYSKKRMNEVKKIWKKEFEDWKKTDEYKAIFG